MGFTLLSSYDTDACATQCNASQGYSAINIYFERDPTVDVGPNCLNPLSQTLVSAFSEEVRLASTMHSTSINTVIRKVSFHSTT